MTSSSSTNASSEALPAPGTKGAGRGTRGRGTGKRRGKGGLVGQLTTAGLLGCLGVVAAAPLLVGGVHRVPMIVLMSVGAVALASLVAGLVLQRRELRMGIGVLAPLALMLVAFFQSVPLPMSVRGLFDPAGNALLQNSLTVPARWWPLSLDPPSTRVHVGRAALALVALLAAYHAAAGQSRRHVFLRVLGAVGVAAVVIGLGHRILGVGRLYGLFNGTGRALITGPFVNANHTAEFLELSTFICLACSFQRPTALNRVGWLVGAALCAGGALATLSRAALVALSAAAFMFMLIRYFGREETERASRRRTLAWGVAILGAILLGGASLGASQVIERLKADGVANDVRLRLWREGLHVLAIHPFGIGRGAFDRLFPVYHSFRVPFVVRFAFVENEPLQLLIDCGWFFFLLLLAALTPIAWRIFRQGRRDRIEAALCGGLTAVLVHSTVDFGLETLGVLLPFCAVVGTVLGRLHAGAGSPSRAGHARWPLVALAGFGLFFGVASAAHPSYDNFDALLKAPLAPDARRALLVRAEQTHPLDYFYPLEQAPLEPLTPRPGGRSPRLHLLNRALELCPACEAVHVEIARNLWRLGLRGQSLLEWRTAVTLQPLLFAPALGELFATGARPQELTSIASTLDDKLKLVRFLTVRGRVPDAFVVLDQADALGAAGGQGLLTRAELQLASGQIKPASDSAAKAAAAGARGPRLAILQARLRIALDGPAGADQALSILDLAATRDPTDLDVQTERLGLVTNFKKWQAAARALEGYKEALYATAGSAADAHIAAARIQAELGHWTAALDEYRIALADRAADVALWVEYARAATASGRDTVARDALSQAARLSPHSPDILTAQHELEQREARLHAAELR